jgi:uncharacterized phiE125 gp8 family phage protein
MRVKVITSPSASLEVVTLEEAKNFLKQVDSLPTLEDALVLTLIKTAREYIERHTGTSLIQKTYELYFSSDELFENCIDVPNPPIYNVTKVELEDEQGILTELIKGSDYYVTGRDKKSIQILTSTISLSNYKSRYVVTYTAGYGIAASGEILATEPIPESLKTAIMQQVLIWYERDGTFEPTLSTQVKMICSEFTDKCGLQ